jgi:hypothetical protein
MPSVSCCYTFSKVHTCLSYLFFMMFIVQFLFCDKCLRHFFPLVIALSDIGLLFEQLILVQQILIPANLQTLLFGPRGEVVVGKEALHLCPVSGEWLILRLRICLPSWEERSALLSLLDVNLAGYIAQPPSGTDC